MATYQINGTIGSVAVTLKSAGFIWTVTTLRRLKIYEFDVGATNTPNATDCNITIDLSRTTQTSLIAGTTYTPAPTDFNDGTAVASALISLTTEPAANSVSTTPLYNNGMNQRNTVRWVAAQESQYFISPATTLNGFVIRASSPNYGLSLQQNFYYLE